MFRSALAFAAAFAWSAAAVASCGSAFCSINTNWDLHSASTEPGLRVDLRYEYIDQDQPRTMARRSLSGRSRATTTRSSTWNRTGSAPSTTRSSGLGRHVLAPLVDREHKHIHNHHGEKLPEVWHFDGLGDVRAVGRYRAARNRAKHSTSATGFLFGVKLRPAATKAQQRRRVRRAHAAAGHRHHRRAARVVSSESLPMKDLSWFAQGWVQLPVIARRLKPGKRFAPDEGLPTTDRAAGPAAAANGLVRGRESLRHAEPGTAAAAAVLSPSADFAVNRDVRIYGFFQVPLVPVCARRAADREQGRGAVCERAALGVKLRHYGHQSIRETVSRSA